MKNLIKAGVTTAMALGAVAAHASLVVGTTSGGTGQGDAILFATVYNSAGTVQLAYAGDTGVTVANLSKHTVPTTFLDANLQTLLAVAATSGNVIYWALEGTSETGTKTNMLNVSSTPTLSAISNQTGAKLNSWVSNLASIATITGSASSATFASAGATGNNFDPHTVPVTDMSDWFGNTVTVAVTGLGTSAGLYELSAAANSALSPVTTTELLNVSLTAAGLTFSAVPIPAALWLLGSGLLGLAGVARRKIALA